MTTNAGDDRDPVSDFAERMGVHPPGEGPTLSDLDDFSPPTRRDVQDLVRVVRLLRDEVATKLPREEADAYRKENARIRRRVTFTILTAVLISLLVGILGNNYAIKRCYLGDTSGHDSLCNALFPGYNKAIDEQNKNLQQFHQLVADIPKNRRINRQQQVEIAKLKRQVRRLEGH